MSTLCALILSKILWHMYILNHSFLFFFPKAILQK